MKWERKTINELCEIKGGKRLPKNHELIEVETNHPYIRARDIGNGIIDFSKPVYLQENTFNFISRYTVKADDIVLTIVGANIGDVGLIPKHLDGANLTENAVKLTSFNENCHFKYLLYYFLLPGKKKQLEQVAAGSAQGKLGLYKIKDIEVPIPPLPTQRKIASILSAYDDLIENNLKRIKLLEEKAFLRYKLIVREEKMQVEEKLENLIQTVKRKAKIPKSDYKEKGEFPIIDQSTDFIGGYTNEKEVVYEDLPMIVFGDHTRILKYVNFPFACGADGTQLIKPNNPNISVAYLYFELINCNLSNYHYARHFKFLKEQVIKLPSEKVMLEYKEETDKIFNLIQLLRLQNTKLREARDILLPKLMNGQIEV